MGNKKGIDINKFNAVHSLVREGKSKKLILARHHISERTFKRIMSVRSFAAYQRLNAERSAAEKANREAHRKAAAKQFNKPMRGTSMATMDKTYKPADPKKVKLVKDELGDEPLPQTKRTTIFERVLARLRGEKA